MGVVYLITNKVNNKQYIGITTQILEKRMKQHISPSKRNINMPICRAIAKYGWHNFTVIILNSSDDFDELKKLEVAAIKNFNTKAPNGYNITDGGDGILGYTHSEEIRKKISIRMFGNTLRLGIKQSKEVLKRQSARLKGTRPANLSFLGRKHSEDTKNKMSESSKKRIRKPASEETKKKMSESAIKRWKIRHSMTS